MPDNPLPECFGPYLGYAIATDFRNFRFRIRTNIQTFDEKNFRLFLLVELKPDRLVNEFEDAFKKGFGVEFAPDVGHTRYVTMRCYKAAVTDPKAWPIWNDYVSRVELSLPVTPSLREPMFDKPNILDRSQLGLYPTGSLLIGVLDDGCPFAAAHFLTSPAGTSPMTRVRAIWDQNQDKKPIPVFDRNGTSCHFGQPLPDFNYGLEFWRDFKPKSVVSPRQIGLDEWIALHSTNGIIDEDGCYADADFRSVMRACSHGAHVSDVFAGRIPTSSRVGPWPDDRRDPPSWAPGTDQASTADLVFVQFSDDCIRDATGVWLKAYVVQGIQYVLSFADPNITKNVVINLSYGPTTGPHDSTAELEEALTALVTEFNGQNGKLKLEIVLAAGNSYLSEGHIAYTRKTAHEPDHIEWTWRLPPDNSVACFAEIWMKKGHTAGVSVTLTSPSGVTYPATLPPALPPAPNAPIPPAGAVGPIAWATNEMWRLQVEPTIAAADFEAAEHGDYNIKVSGLRAHRPLNAYVARSDPNMGVHTGAKRSQFVDHHWELAHSATAGCTYNNGEFDKTGSLIHCHGTLNGIATAQQSSVHVAGGFVRMDGRGSTYSSAGRARGGPRVGPDYALLCDETYALKGLRAGGNRSGSVFRLTGTSAAAPQLARHVAKLTPFPSPSDRPTDPREIEKRGGGNLEPP